MIPAGLCQCGCGRETRIAPRHSHGVKRGQPYRFVKGHSDARKHPTVTARRVPIGPFQAWIAKRLASLGVEDEHPRMALAMAMWPDIHEHSALRRLYAYEHARPSCDGRVVETFQLSTVEDALNRAGWQLWEVYPEEAAELEAESLAVPLEEMAA